MTEQERYQAEIRSIMKISGVVVTKKEKKEPKAAEKPAKKAKKEGK